MMKVRKEESITEWMLNFPYFAAVFPTPHPPEDAAGQ
jgi:hypothetical protein